MKHKWRAGVAVTLGLTAMLMANQTALASERTLDFESVDGVPYGYPDAACIDLPTPPLFNNPIYANATLSYIMTPTGCGKGACGVDNGNNSYLTASFLASGAADRITFSWVDPADSTAWVRLLTRAASGVSPHVLSPGAWVGVGGKISADIAIMGTVTGDDLTCSPRATGAQLEFSLTIGETGTEVPLGEDAGVLESGTTNAAKIEFVGVDSKTGANSTPVGGVPLTHRDPNPVTGVIVFNRVTWEILSTTSVKVSVDSIPYDALQHVEYTKGVVNLSGDNILCGTGNACETNGRVEVDGLAIRKPATDTTTKKWYVLVDNLHMDAPGQIDPTLIEKPVSSIDTTVHLSFIDPLATKVRLYMDCGSGPTLLKEDTVSSVTTHDFTGLTLQAGCTLQASEVIGTEVGWSATVPVNAGILLDDFSVVNKPDGGYGCTGATSVYTTGAWGDTGLTYGYFVSNTADIFGDGSCGRYYDSGYMNGLYHIYPAAIPQDGWYAASVKMKVQDNGNTDGLRQWQVGVKAGGACRGADSCHNIALDRIDTRQGGADGQAVASYPMTKLNTNQSMYTGRFYATAGQDLLVAFSSNVETAWDSTMSLTAGNDGVRGTCDDALDTLDSCEPCGRSCRCPHYSNQGTWNLRANQTNTSTNWQQGGTSTYWVYIDTLGLQKEPCLATASPSVTGPLYGGVTTVHVTGLDTTATAVTVYANRVAGAPIGTVNPAGAIAVDVTVSALIIGDEITATQTVASVESCLAIGPPGVVVEDGCLLTGDVSIATPILTGDTTITVTGVDTTASSVKVYANGVPNGENTAPGGATTVVVTLTNALTNGQTIKATQVVASIEGCMPSTGVVVDNCNQIPGVDVSRPLNEGVTTVTVTGVDTRNDGSVTVQVQDSTTSTIIGGPVTAGSNANVAVTVPALVKGHNIRAMQTIRGLAACGWSANRMVGSGHNAAIRVCLGIRENPALTGPIGGPGGTTGSSIEWVGATGKGTAPYTGGEAPPLATTLLTPGPNWTTVTWAPASAGGTDPVTSYTGGNGTLEGPFGVLEHLAIAATTSAEGGQDVGPYNLYIDNVKQGAGATWTVITEFEGYAANQEVIWRSPNYSGSTAPNVDSPLSAGVSTAQKDSGTASYRLQWRFTDENPGRWARDVTANVAQLGNPEVDVAQPIVMRFLLPCGLTVSGPTPATQTVQVGASATISVSASLASGTVSYQWWKGATMLANGGNISGATSPSLTINPVGAGDAGTDYHCVVADSCTSKTTGNATVVVCTPVTIDPATPADKSVSPPAQATFTCTVTAGSGTLTYEWYKVGTAIKLSDGGNISGATTATLTINPTSVADAGQYYCVVSNGCGTPATSRSATLTVSTSVSISQWRTLKTHANSVGELALVMNAVRVGNASTGPTVESRAIAAQGMGPKKIQVDFNGPVTLVDTSKVTVTYRVTAAGVMGASQTYPAANLAITMVDTDTLQIAFSPTVVADEACYVFTILDGAVSASISGDRDCMLRALVSDGNMSGNITIADVAGAKSRVTTPATAVTAANCMWDYNLSGTFTIGDVAQAKSRMNKAALCPAVAP